MDIATVLGIVLGFAFILISIFMGGGIGAFIDPPSMMIVVGGTIAATLIMYPLGDVINSIKVAMKAFFGKPENPQEIIEKIVELAMKARKESIIALENEPIEHPFLKKGIQLIVDGASADLVKTILGTDIDYMKQRHKSGQGIFKGMGSAAPAFGMIGTLIGLVQMLRSLNDPSSIGPAMAVALITTFYGAILANLIFNPIATKLSNKSDEEVLIREMIIEGVLSILEGENPKIIRQKLESFIPPKLRMEEGGGEGK